jgi:carbon monoxide dehydrogenase subunit G
MSKRKRVTGLFVAAVATAALAVPVVASADHPGQTVELKSTITINPFGSAGKVSASNANCVEDRQVVVKEKGYGKIGSTTTSSTGSWKAEPKYKGDVPLKVWAEVKPVTQGTAGTIYKCLGAISKVRTINGG